MTDLVCPNCGFHNEPGTGACMACGTVLAVPDTDVAPAGGEDDVDPQAQTQVLPSVVACWNCGTVNEQARTFCQACGQQLRVSTQQWGAVPPGGAMPPGAVPPGAVPPAPAGAGDAVAYRESVADAMAAEAARHGPAVAQPAGADAPVGSPAPEYAPPPRRHASERRNAIPIIAAAAAGALLVAGAFVVAGLIGQPASDESRTSAPGAATVASPTPAATAAEPGSGFRCETQSVAAPEPGSWTVYRARWGQRQAFDYVTFQLDRRGDADEAATVTIELLAADEVDGRYGFEAPAGEQALVVTFGGATNLTGPFGGNADQRALRGFRLLRSDGVVYGVIGVDGSGCFQVAAPEWQEGSPRNVDVTIQIERG